MPSFEVNILWLPLIALIFAVIGFILRSAQLRKARQKILSVENEVLKSHAEILELQKDLVRLQNVLGALGDSKTPVVNIKDSSPEEKATAK